MSFGLQPAIPIGVRLCPASSLGLHRAFPWLRLLLWVARHSHGDASARGKARLVRHVPPSSNALHSPHLASPWPVLILLLRPTTSHRITAIDIHEHPAIYGYANHQSSVSPFPFPRTPAPTALSATLSSISPPLMRLSAPLPSCLARRSCSARFLFSWPGSPSLRERSLRRLPTVRVVRELAAVSPPAVVAVPAAAVAAVRAVVPPV